MRLLAAALLAATLPVSAQTLTDAQQQQIAATAETILHDTGVPSASVGIVQGGQVVYTRAFGLANVAPPKRADASMAYPIGSISKQFTATAVLLLQQQGKLSVDDPVAKYFPELTRAKDVKLRNLMTMTSGYEDFAPQDYIIPAWYKATEPIKTVREWAGKPLDFEPGTQWQYSNTNYVLLALIIEKVTGEPFYKYLRENVLDAAHLPGVFNTYTEREKLQVTGYVSYAMQSPRVLPLEAPGWYFGDGDLSMPASTLLAWDLTFINQSLLSAASYQQMETPFALNDGKSSGYGLGVFARNRNGHLELEHSGEVGGYVAENIVYPNDKLAIVVLTNEVASSAAGEIGTEITKLLLPDAMPKSNAAADPMAATIKGILTGIANGKIDRTLFTADCNAYFDAAAIADFRATLSPLGEIKSVTRMRSSLRGGMTFGLWSVTTTSGTTLRMDTYTMPDGKIEQFLILEKE